MAFQTPLKIKEVVEEIHKRKFLLPAIQREVVWNVYQITRLFDSLMRDYPIGSFLFWQVDRTNIQNYQFYEFVRDFHERDNYRNEKADVKGQEDIVGILDGQQRLTALYLGLKGSYTYKEPKKWRDNPQAFPTRSLYLNLLGQRDSSEETDLLYDFSFLTDEEAKKNGSAFWFQVGNVLDLKDISEVNGFLNRKELINLSTEQKEFASKALFKLWEVVHVTPLINYYLEKDQSLDKVLNVFIRVNSGGTILSYSDLLLSVATAQWKQNDARDVILSFVDEINATGDGFRFDKDVVLKSCIVLAGIKDISFKVDNFNKTNMLKIEQEWEKISSALRSAVTLASSFGYNRDTLTANYSIIPIAYYLKKINNPKNFESASNYLDDRKRIRRWLTLSLVKRSFGGAPDSVLRPIREVIDSGINQFPIAEIIDKFRGTPKSLVVTVDDIENILNYRYGQGYTFSTLALLYPNLDFHNKFHLDHIHPRIFFTRSQLARKGIAQTDIDFCVENFNLLPNLQLLEGVQNLEKSSSDFDAWISSHFPDSATRDAYIRKNFIPNVDFSISNFKKFFEHRRDLMRDQLNTALGI